MWWFMSAILAMWETKVRGLQSKAGLSKKKVEDYILKK
jgi:hypothetical protein